jgi:hypothetical protein
MPLSSNSNVNVTAPAELTNARLSIAPITHRVPKVIFFMTRSQVVTPRAEIMVPPLRSGAAIPARVFKRMSAMIFLRRSWKIPRLTTSIRLPNHHVNAQYPAGVVPRRISGLD